MSVETLTEVEKTRTVVLLEQVGRRRVARVARHQQPMRRGGRVVLRAEGQGDRGSVAGGGALRLHEARVAAALARRSPRVTRGALVRSHLRRRLARLLPPRILLPHAAYEEAERTRAPGAAQARVAVGAAAAPARLVGGTARPIERLVGQDGVGEEAAPRACPSLAGLRAHGGSLVRVRVRVRVRARVRVRVRIRVRVRLGLDPNLTLTLITLT